MSVALVVPWRGGNPDRERACAWLAGWWARTWPDWDLVMGQAPDGPWCKAAAVADALTRTDADTLIVADADVYVPGIGQAVDMVTRKAVAWAMPHLRVYRLTAAGTARFTTTGKLPPPTRVRPARGSSTLGEQMVAESHRGEIGGGCVVLPRALYQRAPMDPRFLGWGQEDQAWGRALTVLAGPPWRVNEPLWHLWHAPPTRVGPNDPPGHTRVKRGVGNMAGRDLYRRYRAASTPADMRALLDEFGGSSGETVPGQVPVG